jgi:hypothetical protein
MNLASIVLSAEKLSVPEDMRTIEMVKEENWNQKTNSIYRKFSLRLLLCKLEEMQKMWTGGNLWRKRSRIENFSQSRIRFYANLNLFSFRNVLDAQIAEEI